MRNAMVSVVDRSKRLRESALKIEMPFELDESLCLYSPQDNVDALSHPRLVAWFDFIQRTYEPRVPDTERRILLFMPCTKTKPYPFSSEHLAINQRLFDAGFRPTQPLGLPQELQARLEPRFSPEILNLSPLSDGRGTCLHRMVISEPMGVVPYEHIATFPGGPSPAVAYDDPGLFEDRGNAVSPWRADSTAVQTSPTSWRWGDEERRHYVLMHNEMARVLATVVARIGPYYTDIVAWVAPGLTHRSFVLASEERRTHKVPLSRKVGAKPLKLVGANDHLPIGQRIACLPTSRDCRSAIERLRDRLGVSAAQATAIYARGGANATPLALPELLDVLVARLTDASPLSERSDKHHAVTPDNRP
jgi:hypothetical protein